MLFRGCDLRRYNNAPDCGLFSFPLTTKHIHMKFLITQDVDFSDEQEVVEAADEIEARDEALKRFCINISPLKDED
jgi:hypothetical protein